MIQDALLQYSDSQELTADANSTNTIDHGQEHPGLGVGEPMAVVVTLGAAADGADADETYSVTLQTADDEAFTDPTTLITGSIPAGSEAGSKIVLPVPPNFDFKRYSRLSYDLGGTTPGATVSATLVPMEYVEATRHYADARTIS